MGTIRGVALWAILLAAASAAQEHQHGSAAEKLGTVSFATSCSAPAQAQFNRSVALLHSFQFLPAITAFNATLSTDPNCAMAYWGIALSNWGNPMAQGLKPASQQQQGSQAIARAQAVGAKTAREKAYIGAVGALYNNFEHTPQRARVLAYRNAMADVAAAYPEDQEAAIFYALSLAAAADPADKTYADQLKAGAILEKIFQQQPDHPGLAHYIIHTYDVPPLAGRALAAARRYSQIAPSAPHALHMPSHTYTRVGYWQDSVDSNLAAGAAAKREGQVGEELHTMDYRMYAYLQMGRDAEAKGVLEALPEVWSRLDPGQTLSGAASPSAGAFASAAIAARWALERRDWAAAAKLELHPSPYPYVDAITWFARGLGAARLGDSAGTQAAAAALRQLGAQLQKGGEPYWAQQVDIQQRLVAAWGDFAAGHRDQALLALRAAVDMEDSTEKSAVTPGPILPARELLGEMLLEQKQPAEALAQFEATLKKEPNRFHALYGAAHAAQLAGDGPRAQRYYADLLKVCTLADRPGRAELAEARKMLVGEGERASQ